MVTPLQQDQRRAAVVMHVNITDQKQSEAAVRRSEQRLELATRSARIGIWDWDVVRNQMIWDKQMYSLYGITEKEFSGAYDTWQNGLHPEDRGRAERELTATLAKGRDFDTEFRVIWPNKEIRHVEAHGLVQRAKDGSAVRMIGVNWDITERKRAEERRRQSEAALALAQSVARLGSWELDLVDLEDINANILRWSDETFRIFGHEPNAIEVSNKAFLQSVHPDDRASVEAGMAAMMQTGGRYILEHRIILPNGAERVVREEAIVIYDERGQVPRKIAGTVQDISARSAVEAKVREQAALLDIAHDAIMVRDMNDIITFWNRGAESIYGWASDEAIGRSAIDLLYSDSSKAHLAKIRALEAGEWSGELYHLRRDGKKVIVSSRWTLLRNSHGNPMSILVINSDITDHKKLEEQFLRAQRLESIGTLASGVAHDLNNILAPILMSAPMLRDDMPRELRERIVSNIELSAQRGADIVRQVLTFARGEEGERILLQPIHLIKDMARIAEETFPKSIRIRTKYPPTLWTIEADPTQMHQVLLNLCVNARDAMPDGGELILSVENVSVDEHFAAMTPETKPGPYVLLRVSDTGSGIAPGVIDQIFDPFFTTKALNKGTGLGLSTTIGIIKSHGGAINVTSEVDAGTVFNVYLPASDAVQPCFPEEEQAPPEGNGELILVVDDEQSIRETAQIILEKHGYKVLVAADGTDALAIFAQHMNEIKAVLTDVMMPYRDGVTLIRTLRKMKPAIAVIASTGRSDNQRVKELGGLNVSVCLIKPYDSRKLLMAIRDAVIPFNL